MLYERDMVSFRAGDLISICPPLMISRDEIDFLVDALDDALGQISKDLRA